MTLRTLLFWMASCAVGAAVQLRSETVALWLFDEQTGMQRVPGKFGSAFRPSTIESPAGGAEDFAAGLHRGGVNPKLNLGEGDWTMECWLKLDDDARAEGILFEIGTGLREKSEFVTRLSVLPAENAFALASLTAAPNGVAKRVELPNPEGPPVREAWLGSSTLALSGDALPRERWFHVAVVHSGNDGALKLFIEGRLRAVAVARMIALPWGSDPYLSIGSNGQGRQPLQGAIDELRVSDQAVYAREFVPPGSFSTPLRP